MTQVHSAEMVFSSNRAEPATASDTARSGRLDLVAPVSRGEDPFAVLLDRIEQLEFALAEAVIRSDQPSDSASVDMTKLSDRLDKISEDIAGLSGAHSAVPYGDLPTEKITRILDRLDAAAAARADETTMIASRLEALERASDARFGPMEAAISSISEALARDRGDAHAGLAALEDKFLPLAAIEDLIRQGTCETEEMRAAQNRILSRIEALPTPVDLSQEVAEISARLAALPPPPDVVPVLSEMSARLAGLGDIQEGFSAIAARMGDLPSGELLDRLAERFGAFEGSVSSRMERLADATEAVAARPLPAPDLSPLRETTARHMVAQKAIADRQTAQIEQLLERFEAVEVDLKAVPGAQMFETLQSDVSETVDNVRQPLVTRMDAIAGMLTSLVNDVTAARDLVPDIAALRDPLLDRMDRLDTTADQRQRELSAELSEVSERPFPVTDLTPMRESFARLMVALQAMHQGREAIDADMTKQISTLSAELQGLPDKLEASADQRQRDLIKDVEGIAERPMPAPDLTPVRETMARFMVALQTMEQNRANTEVDMIARITALAEQINAMPNTAEPHHIEAVNEALKPLHEALSDTRDGIKVIADRPVPTLDIATVRSAFAQQMTAISTWMKRQDGLQATLSELLETLVDQGSDAVKGGELAESLKTMIAASQYNARKQLEGLETRLSEQMSHLASSDTVGDSGEDTVQTLEAVEQLAHQQRDVAARLQEALTVYQAGMGHVTETEPGLLGENERLHNAVLELKQAFWEGSGEIDPELLKDHSREIRLALAELLATLQASQLESI